MKTITLRLPGMCCPVEFGPVERLLKKRHPDIRALPDYGARTVRFTLPDASPVDGEALLAIVRETGGEAECLPDAARPAASGARVRIRVPEMDCPVEAGEIEREFEKAGIAGHEINVMNRTITVDAGLSERALTAIRAAGYEGSLEDARPEGAASSRILLSVPEMDCPVEAAEIEREFARAGITGHEINIMNRTIAIDSSLVDAARAAVSAAGYEASVMERKTRTPEFEDRTPWRRYFFALAVALVCEFTEMAGESGLIPLGETALSAVTLVLALAAISLVGLTTFRKGIESLLHRTLNMNTLMSVAVTGGVLIGAWPEAAMVLVLFEISEAIEQLSMARARRSIRDLMEVAPEKALVSDERGGFTEMPVGSIGIGACIRVAPGDRVPLDGRIEEGSTTLDQSMVTGESMPAEKKPGDTVWAGTVNLTSTLLVRVTAPASQSLTNRIIEAVENAQASKSPVQRFVDRFAAVYTPIVFVVALAVALLPPLFLGNWMDWIYKALCLLVIACPCALVISTPVTIVSALSTATRCGLLIKGGLFLEEARKLRNIGLDKTGTLTKGEPRVESIRLFSGTTRERALTLAGSLGAMNRHPLSLAIAAEAHADGVPLLPVEDFTALPGSGVKGRIGRGRVMLLNLAALEKAGTATPEVRDAFEAASARGRSSVALADAFGVLAVFVLADEIKEDTRSGIVQLADVGITPWLLTGDNSRAARALADELGLANVYADLLPEEKLARIRELQEGGLTAMMGDGINDAPALAQADIGIAMGVRGTDSAIEAADIAVMDDRVSSVATLVRLSRMTHAVLVQNIAFALGIKVLFALLAVSGFATMWMAVFADTGTCLIVVANGMRMLRAKPRLDALARAADERAKAA